jgi:hypothetical protein
MREPDKFVLVQFRSWKTTGWAFENLMIAEDQKTSARESKNQLLANSYLAGFSERPRLADHRSAEQIFLNLRFRAQCQLTTRH